jgi:GPH family glycoside/pentoside/hexuronide:cation symporter
MLAGAVTMGASFWLLLRPPQGLGTLGLFAWLVATTLAFRSSSALFRIPYLSLGAEMSADYDERTAIVAARSVFGLLGTLAAGGLSFALFFPGTGAGGAPTTAYAAYPAMGLGYGLLMTACAIAATLGTWRHRRDEADRPGASRVFLRDARLALRNRSFRAVWTTVTLFFLAAVVNAAVAIQYFTWYARLGEPGVIGRMQAAFYLGAVAGVPLWTRASRRVEKRSLTLGALVATAALLAMATWLVGEGAALGVGRSGPLAAGHFLAGLCAGALWVLPGSMLADVADQDEWETGARREGLFFGMLNFGEKVGAGVALLVTGLVLDHVVGLTPGGAPTAPAIARLGWVYGALPAGVLVVAAWQLRGYVLSRPEVARLQALLAARATKGPGPGVAGIAAETTAGGAAAYVPRRRASLAEGR